jgi:2-dehydropantoate 2-reductase
MRIAVFGAGAIGGYLAVELARAGQEIAVIARGANLEAIRAHGLRLRIGGEERRADVQASDDPAAIGPVEFLILAVKANALPGIAASLGPLLGPRSAVVTAINGVPFWYTSAARPYEFNAKLYGEAFPSGSPGRREIPTDPSI